MASNENLYHKLLGLPEELDAPNYFQLLELNEGDASGPQVEEGYKKQIQKVQRYTNNPKYKEGALFLKGELRKARTALVDESRRSVYMRELMQSRTGEIREVIKPLLIKGYVVTEEYAYLAEVAKKTRVPESVVQQVIKQELEKKGIDPTQALVDAEAAGIKKGRSVMPGRSARRGASAPMTWEARFPILRRLHPSELFTVETAKALAMSPLWLLGVKRHQPQKGQGGKPVLLGGLVFNQPFIAAILLFCGIALMVWPFSNQDVLGWKAELESVTAQRDGRLKELDEEREKVAKLTKQVNKLKTGGGPSSEEVEQLQEALEKAREENKALASERDTLKGKITSLEKEIVDLKQSSGSGVQLTKDEYQKLLKAEIKVEALEAQLANLKDAGKLVAERDAAKAKAAELTTQVTNLTSKNKDLEAKLKAATGFKTNDALIDVLMYGAPGFKQAKPGTRVILARSQATGEAVGAKVLIQTEDEEDRKRLTVTDKIIAFRVSRIGELQLEKPGRMMAVIKKLSEGSTIRSRDRLFILKVPK